MLNLASLAKYKFSPLHNEDGSPCYFRASCLAIFAVSLIIHVVTKPSVDTQTNLVAEGQNFNPQEILASTIVDSEDVAAVGRSVNINTASYQNNLGNNGSGAVMIGQRGEISLNPLKTVATDSVKMTHHNAQSLELNGAKLNMPTSGTISIPTASISPRVPGTALQSSTAVQPPIPQGGEELVATNVTANVAPAVAAAGSQVVTNSTNASTAQMAASTESKSDSFWSFFGNDDSKNRATEPVSKDQTANMKALAQNRSQALTEMVNGISLLLACGKISSTYDKCSFDFSKKVRNNFDTQVMTTSDAFGVAIMAKGNQLADECVRYEFSSTGIYRAYDNKGQLSQTCLQDPTIEKQVASIHKAIATLDRNAQKAETLATKM